MFCTFFFLKCHIWGTNKTFLKTEQYFIFFLQSSAPELEAYQAHQSPVIILDEDKLKAAGASRPSSMPLRQAEQQVDKQFEDGYEVMKSIGSRSGEANSSESPKPSIVVLKEPSSPALGGTVNLIFSLGNTGDSQVQVLDPPSRTDEVVEETSEPVHRVRNTLAPSHY